MRLPILVADFGRKGAAFAALGEIPIDFLPFVFVLSAVARNDGVKLGDSTLNDFLRLF